MKLSLLPKSNLISNFFSKKVFLCLVFLCFVGSVFCTEYVWTGGGDGSTWTDENNWGGSGYPGESDIALFSNNLLIPCITSPSEIKIAGLRVASGCAISFGNESLTNIKLTVTTGDFSLASNSEKPTLTNYGTIILEVAKIDSGATFKNYGTVSWKGALSDLSGKIDNEGDFTIEGTAKVSSGGQISNSKNITFKQTLENTGTITNTGDFTSEGAITNQSGGSITNNSSGTISGNINNTGSFENSGGITGTITNNAGGTVTDSGTISGGVSGDGTYEDNHIVVKTYSTISSVTDLVWNDDSSWENGEIPDISGKTAVKIELNANISAETLAFNSSGSNKIELFLNGNTLTVENIYLESNIDHTDKNYGNLHIYGDGAVKITTFDTSNNSEDTVPHKMFLYNGAEIYVTTNLYPDQSKVEITDSSKNCKFYLTASGANVNYGESGINYIDINPEPYGEPQIYKVIDMGGNPFSATGKKIQFYTEKDTNDTNIQPINFQYSVEILGENQNWTLDGTSLTKTTDFSNLPVVTILPTEVEKILVLQCSTSLESLAVGEGIIITIKTPDGTMDLAEIRCLKSEILWTGKQDTYFSDPANWTIDGEDLDDIAELENQAVVIPSGCTNYPTLQSNITVKKISIKTNASLTVSTNGKLTTEKLELTGTGKILASDGTVKFTDSGANPSYSSETPYLSTFGTIEVVSGTFNLNYPLTLTQLNIASGAIFSTSNELVISSIENSGDFSTTADLHIKKSLTNNGIFQAGKVYLEPSEKNITITGKSGVPEEIANNTKITELYCENQADKNLVINNSISVEKIALSGNKNASGKRLTVKYDKDNYSSGIVYLENNYDEAKYLFLADNSLVTIKNATITVYESDTQHISATNFVEKGWRLGDPKKFIWVGKTNDWNNPANWDYGTVPTPGKPVEIPTGPTNYPVLDSDINLIDETALTKEDSLLVKTGAEINFAGKKVSVTNFENLGEVEFKGGSISSISIKNSGTVILTGKEEISGEISESGIVIYSGTETDAKFSWGNNYKNLEIEAGFTGSFENGVIVSDSLKIVNGFEITEKQDNTKNLVEISGTGTLSNMDTIEITSTGNQSFNGKIILSKILNITSDDKLTIATQSDFTNEGTIASKDISINSPTVNLAGTISAETNISISGELYIIGESSISFGENFVIGTDLEPKDIYISALDSNNEAASVNFIPKTEEEEAKIQIYGNFALFNGDVSLGTELVVGKDMILLNGKTSGVNSIYKDNMTGFDLFKYYLDDRPVSCNLQTFPTDIPNNENISISHEEYKSTFTVENEKVILVWHNFYSNGVDLSNIKLHIPANDAATSSFAECYNATITNCVVSENTSPGEAWLSTENCTDGTGNTNVAFSKAIFANVATISDNIIRVSFVDGNSPLDEKPEIKIENSCNEISAWLENFRFNISSELPEGIKFSGIFANPECTKSTNGKDDLSTFYLKYEIPTDGSIDYRWNTDATGSAPGAEESTDTSGVHKNVVPNLAFKRTIEASYAGLRDEHKNRLVSVGTDDIGTNPLFTETKDEVSPVLIAVTLGQEQHEIEAASQHHYDSHNFIEWQFSEPVEITYNSVSQGGFGTSTGTELVSNAENIQTTENFGKITNANNGFSVAGLGSFQNGKVTVGSKTGSGEVNAFYRNFALEAGKTATAQEFRIRLSIAGYVDEGNPVTVNGVDYKNWLGFIDSKNTTIPSGTFTMEDSAFLSIKDKSENKNPLVQTKNQPVTVNAMLSAMNEDSKRKTLYGTWDIDPPVVANYMKEDSSNIYAQELIAVNNTSGEIAESLELHFLDNSVYNKYEGKENLQWRTKIGWIKNNVHMPQNIPLDIRGGSRMVSTENQTYGGVRFSTLVDVLDSFVCKNLTTGENIVLNELSQSTTNEVLFGESAENQFDVPYLTLKFENAKGSLLKHNFELEYNKNSQKTAFITDLAGNLLYEFSVKSPDKNPPQFLLSIGGVNHDKLYILFSKPIDYLNQNNEPDEGKLRRIVKSLSIFESSSDGKKDTELISYKLGSQAKVVTETKESTGIEISLTRSVSYDELKNLYIGINSFDSGIEDGDGDSSQRDPITGEMGKYSMLYDMFENPISEDSKHCFSDFAVNAFDVLYAYDGRAIEDAALNQGVFGGNQWTVTDFSGEINNSSKVIAGKDITIAGKIVDFSDNPDNQDKFSMLADISPSKNKPDLDFTDYSGINTRLWFSDFVKYFPVNNSITSNNYTTDNLLYNGKIETTISGKDNQSFTYVIPNDKEDSQSVNWVDGDEFEFLFKVLDSNNEVIMVDGNVDGDTDDEVDHPLFALRLKDENDITSIDLWSLHVVELLRQKGGATILNNVINSLNNEETAIEIQVPQTGFLTVQVLTLDGNVVKVLQKGRVEEGTYYYKWNGTNNSGAAVARGMYFIRVVGPKIDETRKVMVIKE